MNNMKIVCLVCASHKEIMTDKFRLHWFKEKDNDLWQNSFPIIM